MNFFRLGHDFKFIQNEFISQKIDFQIIIVIWDCFFLPKPGFN